jgi:hypothetical protein
MKKLLTIVATLVALTSVAQAYDPGSSEANMLRMNIFYHDVCPYGRVNMPERVWDEISSRWAYIPDGTKRRADTVVYQMIEDTGVAKFCATSDEWFAKNHPDGNPLAVRAEKALPEFGILMVNAVRESNTRYVFFTVVLNNTTEDRNTEWTCVLNNTAKRKVYEEKFNIDVKAKSRVVTRHVVHYDGNADNVLCTK